MPRRRHEFPSPRPEIDAAVLLDAVGDRVAVGAALGRALRERHARRRAPLHEDTLRLSAVERTVGLAARFLTALDDAGVDPHDEREIFRALAVFRPTLARLTPTLVRAEPPLTTLITATGDGFVIGDGDTLPGFLEEEAAELAVVLAAADAAGSEPLDRAELAAADALVGSARADRHATGFLVGLELLRRAASTNGADAPDQRAYVRRLVRAARFCFDRADEAPFEELLERALGIADPWIALDVLPGNGRGAEAAAHDAFLRARWRSVEDAPADGRRVELGGRLRSVRKHRQTVFADLASGGRRIQIALRPDTVSAVAGPRGLRAGDSLVVFGDLSETKTGERTIFCRDVAGWRPNRAGASVLDDEPVLVAHATLLASLRSRLEEDGFLEQITPVLSEEYAGGEVTPFVTWQAYRGRPAYLRVTSELNLVRSVAAGMTRCYELGASFLNGSMCGLDKSEFLLLEAYATDMSLAEFLRYTVQLIVENVYGNGSAAAAPSRGGASGACERS